VTDLKDHNLKPKPGDVFYMNMSRDSFKNPEGNAAFLRHEDAADSAACWADEEDEPWLVMECRVIEVQKPPRRAPEFRT
jgi:hypothetical protein